MSDKLSDKFIGTEEHKLRARIDLLEGTLELVGRRNTRLLSVVQLVHDALAGETWDGRWSNTLMQAHQVAHGMLADSSVPIGQHLTPNDRLAFNAAGGEPIGKRLRKWCHEVNAASAQDLMDEAADEIERLEKLRQLDGESMGVLIAECQDMKDRLINGDQIEPLHNGVAGYTDGISAVAEVKQSVAEIARLRLTDEEREAIDCFAKAEWTSLRWSKVKEHCATLRELLERLK